MQDFITIADLTGDFVLYRDLLPRVACPTVRLLPAAGMIPGKGI